MVYGWTAAGRQKRDLDTCVHQQADTHSVNNREVFIFFSAVVNSDNSVRQGSVHIADDQMNVFCRHTVFPAKPTGIFTSEATAKKERPGEFL
jgi:hypothetical protein